MLDIAGIVGKLCSIAKNTTILYLFTTLNIIEPSCIDIKEKKHYHTISERHQTLFVSIN